MQYRCMLYNMEKTQKHYTVKEASHQKKKKTILDNLIDMKYPE